MTHPKLTHSALVALLQGTPGTIFASLVAVTDARLHKTGNPLPLPVVKLSVISNATIGADYGKAVEREATRQGGESSFAVGPLPVDRTWLVPGKVLVDVKTGTKLYLRTQSTPGQRRKFRVKRIGFRDSNGHRASLAQVKPFLPPVYESAKQQAQAGLTATVWVRDYLMTSIALIKINRVTYELVA